MPNSYDKIISSAQTLFWKHGIKKVSVEEICRDAGVSKMSFYRQFENKSKLAIRILEDLNEKSMAEYQGIMSSNLPFPEKIKEVVFLKNQYSQGISKELIQDIYNLEMTDIQACIQKLQINSKEAISSDLLQAQKDGWIKEELSIEYIMYMMENIGRLTADEAYLNLFNSTSEAIVQATEFFFAGISTHKVK